MKKNLFVFSVFFVLFVISSQAYSLTPVEPIPPVNPCLLSALSPTSYAAGQAAGYMDVSLSTGTDCSWEATCNADWLHFKWYNFISKTWVTTSSTSGSGSASIRVYFDENPGLLIRTGTVTIKGQTFTVNQTGNLVMLCTWSISPTSYSVENTGGSQTVTVTSNCDWTASESLDWVSLSTTSGSGNGSLTVTVDANPGILQRSGTVTIAGKTFDIEQDGTPLQAMCLVYSLSPETYSIGSSGGSCNVGIDVDSSCNWTAVANDAWLSVSPGSGTGDATVSVTVEANSSLVDRVGTVTINNETFTVTQAAAQSVETTYQYYVPYFSSQAADWIGLAISNGSNTSEASVEIGLYGSDGEHIKDVYKTLSARGKTAFSVTNDDSIYGWLLINSDQPLAGCALIGHDSVMADIPFVDSLYTDILIPHIAQDENWNTTVMICNPQASAVTVTLVNVNDDGDVVAQSSEITIAAQGSCNYTIGDLFGAGTITGKVYLQASDEITAFALYGDIEHDYHYFAGINAVEGSYE